MKWLQLLLDKWNHFWFKGPELLPLGVFRAILCTTLGVLYLSRSGVVKELFTDEGMVPRNVAMRLLPEFYTPPVQWFFATDSNVEFWHGAMVAALFLLALGIGNRVTSLLTWILVAGFHQRNFSIIYGADIIGAIFLFYMSFTQSCAQFSLLNYFRKQKTVIGDHWSGVFWRLLQIQLCVIYTYTGFEKLKGQSWWDGTALWMVFGNPQMMTFDLSFLRFWPAAVMLITYATVLFEIYFVVMVANKKTRPWILAMGLMFHGGIGIFMNLPSFAFVMLSAYVLFLSHQQIAGFLSRLRRFLPQAH